LIAFPIRIGQEAPGTRINPRPLTGRGIVESEKRTFVHIGEQRPSWEQLFGPELDPEDHGGRKEACKSLDDRRLWDPVVDLAELVRALNDITAVTCCVEHFFFDYHHILLIPLGLWYPPLLFPGHLAVSGSVCASYVLPILSVVANSYGFLFFFFFFFGAFE
jgi:hypothetical protein